MVKFGRKSRAPGAELPVGSLERTAVLGYVAGQLGPRSVQALPREDRVQEPLDRRRVAESFPHRAYGQTSVQRNLDAPFGILRLP